MAFSIASPKHQQEIEITGFEQVQILTLVVETVKALNWKLSHTSPSEVICFTHFSFSSYSEKITIGIENSKVNILSQCTGLQMIDYGKNKKNVLNFLSKINELKEKFTVEELSQKHADLLPLLVSKEEDLINQAPKSSNDKITNIFSIFIPRTGFFITPILIDINIIIFILMAINGAGILIPDNQILINWGANFKPLTLSGQWWRLFTCIFLHAGAIHLLMNMYALLYIGLILEPYLGNLRFASFYLLTGIVASTASFWWHDTTVSIGASGAIFGMYGVFLAMLTTNLIEKTARKTLLVSIGIFVGYNLLNGMKGGIDNAAHIGGLISGILIGYGSYFSLKDDYDMELKLKTVLIASAIAIGLCSLVYTQTPNKYAFVDDKMKEFELLESEALRFYHVHPLNPTNTLDEGIKAWNQCLVICDTIDKVKMPVGIQERTDKLREYVKLRIETYQLLRDAYSSNNFSDQLKGQITSKNKKIQDILNSFKNN